MTDSAESDLFGPSRSSDLVAVDKIAGNPVAYRSGSLTEISSGSRSVNGNWLRNRTERALNRTERATRKHRRGIPDSTVFNRWRSAENTSSSLEPLHPG